jgi:hypothetical protein
MVRKLEIGCGQRPTPGYIHNDLNAFAGVDIVGTPWEIDFDHFEGRSIPFTIYHVFSTLYGWQRWPGDEHKSGWWQAKLEEELRLCGFDELCFGVQLFLEKGLVRNRFSRPHDAHIYCRATKSKNAKPDQSRP